MATKYYFQSLDTDSRREVVIEEGACYPALIRLWHRELELLRAIPAASLLFIDLSQCLFDPIIRVHHGQRMQAIEMPTAPILSAFDDEDRRLILQIMAANWTLVHTQSFIEDSKFFN